MADVKAAPDKWFWEPYIPDEELTLLHGDPGVGKSWFVLWYAERVARGVYHPAGRQQHVLILTQEDRPEKIRNRLNLLGADEGSLRFIEVVPVNLTLDAKGLGDLEATIKAKAPDVVIIDPIAAYLGAELDMYRQNQVRAVLGPLGDMAHRLGTVIAVVAHDKKGGGKAVHKAIGSVDFTAAVRSALFFTAEGDDVIMSHSKANYSRKGPALRFGWDDAGRFDLEGEAEGDANYYAADEEEKETRSAIQDAVEWLRERVKDDCVPSKVLEAELDAQDISFGTYKRARRALKKEGLKAEQRIELGDGWFTCMGMEQRINPHT